MIEVEGNRKFEQVFFPIYIVLAVVISCIAGLTIYAQYDTYITSSYYKTLAEVTELVEHQFPLLTDPQRLEGLLREDSDVYWDIQRTVQNIQASCGLRSVFVWQRKEDGWHFLLSSDYPRGTPLEKILELHKEYIPVREQAYQSKTMILTVKPVTNQWGTFMSVFRPLIKDGEVACILGAAIDISSVKSLHAQAIYAILGAFLVSLVISVIFALISRRIINRLEGMIRRRSDELEAQTKLANEASQAKSRFLANMSHEIRTPMNAIIGLSDLIRTDNLDSTQRAYFENIKKMSNSLLHSINDILDFSKVDAGKIGAEKLEQSAIETCLAEQGSGNGPDAVPVEAMKTLEAELNSVLDVLHQTTTDAAEPVMEREIGSDENHREFKILAVDDDRANVSILHRILSPEYTVLTANSGERALKYAVEEQPDIILLDIILPDMNGFDILVKLKENPLTREIPVIIISGLNSEQDEEKGLCLSAVDYITKPFNNTIVRARIKTHIDIISHRRVIEKLSLIDPLTDIPNRRAFNDRIQMEWKRAIREKNPLSFLMIDLDNFKHYNDTYGHLQGDRLLKTVAQIFVDSAKRPADMSIRWGGEEFAVLLPHTDLKAAHIIAERIRSRVESTQVPITGGTLMTSITLSIGLASIVPTQDSSINDFIALADKYLYQAKDTGKNRICSIETTEYP
ncbi:MAG: diguanylate cyclase [Treponema sp.]|jgi:diguanylate cyclase (GGDEF)-like protein|nr:diguanylate cyclase [Treponema sp.]